MIPPSPAQRRDWFAANWETPTAELDHLYGTGHRPAIQLVGAMWAPTCGCADPHCWLAEDDTRRLYNTPDQARDAAARNLRDNEHGPSAGQEETP